jgi:hypothetical protein
MDSDFNFKLDTSSSIKSANSLEMNTNHSNPNELAIESSKGSLASKLSGVDLLTYKREFFLFR